MMYDEEMGLLSGLLQRIGATASRSDEWKDGQGALKTNHGSLAMRMPKQLPEVAAAMSQIADELERESETLYGVQPIELFGGWCDIRSTWLVGSFVWRAAVFGERPAPGHDMDVVFLDPEGPGQFIDRAARIIMERRKNGKTVSITKNKFGSPRLVDPATGEVKIDAWALPENQTIAEHISGYPWLHQRVAYLVGSVHGEIHGLTRLVRPAAFNSRLSGD